MMNQIFQDHLPYMIGSAVVALALFFAPRQTKWAKRLAVSILVLACLYPCGIVWLYAARNNMGESYGYLIGGILLGILMGLIAGALFLSWIIVYLVGIKKRKQTSNQGVGGYGSQTRRWDLTEAQNIVRYIAQRRFLMTRLNLNEDVKPLSEFRANVTTCIRQTRKTRRPLVITHHGKSAAVLLGVSEYEALMQKMEILEDIRLAEDQIAHGGGISHDTALKQVLAKVHR